MALLNKKDLVNRYNKRQTFLVSEDGEKSFSKSRLSEFSKSFSYSDTYDIFLSHSFDDARWGPGSGRGNYLV